jgi:hypothetical protein
VRERVALVVPDWPVGLTPRLSEWVRDLIEAVGEEAGLESLAAIASECMTAVMKDKAGLGCSVVEIVEHRLKQRARGLLSHRLTGTEKGERR